MFVGRQVCINRSERGHDETCAIVKADASRAEIVSADTGVTRDSMLRQLDGFRITEQQPIDIFHDEFEGARSVARRKISLIRLQQVTCEGTSRCSFGTFEGSTFIRTQRLQLARDL